MHKLSLLRKWLYPILFVLYVAWTVPGAFPPINYESDASNVLGGAAYIVANGEAGSIWDYNYEEQTLSYWLLAGISKLTGIGVETSYCLLSWFAMILLTGLAVGIINRVTGLSRCIILLSWWLLPESYACGMYGNTAVLATTVMMAGLWCITKRKLIAGTVLLCVAPLLRIDVVCVYPVVFPLMRFLGMKWHKSLGISALMAVAVAVTGVVGVWIFGDNLFKLLDAYGFWNRNIVAVERVKAIVGCYSIVGIIYILAGVAIMVRQKKYLTLAVLAVPIIADHLVFMKMGCASKHFLYALPFAAGIAAYPTQWMVSGIRRTRPVAIGALGMLLAFETCYAVVYSPRFNLYTEKYNDSLPEDEKMMPRLEICTFNISQFNVRIGIGIGFCFNTADEIMFLSGNAFYSMTLHNLKTEYGRRNKAAMDFIDRQRNYVAVTLQYADHPLLPVRLLEQGWRVSGNPSKIMLPLKKCLEPHYTKSADMTDAKENKISLLHLDPSVLEKTDNTDWTIRHNIMVNLVTNLPRDSRPSYIIIPGYEAYLISEDMRLLEEEGLVRRKAPWVWQIL